MPKELAIVNISANLDTQDVVAIKLSNLEEALFKRQELLQKARADLTAQIKQAGEALTSMYNKHATAILFPDVSAVLKPLKVLIPEVEAHFQGFIQENFNINQKDLFSANWTIFTKTNNVITGKLDTPIPDFITKARDEFKMLQSKLSITENDIIEVRKALGQMAVAERRIRGMLAKNKLEASTEGKKILRELESLEMKDILGKALPAPQE